MDTCVALRQEGAHFIVNALVGMYTWILVQKLPKSGTSIMDDHTGEYMVRTWTVHRPLTSDDQRRTYGRRWYRLAGTEPVSKWIPRDHGPRTDGGWMTTWVGGSTAMTDS